MPYMLGRKPRSFNSKVPHMSALVAGRKLAPPPPAIDYLAGMPADLGMMLNGPDPNDPNAPELGDCTCAAAYHGLQVWSFNASGKMLTEPNSAVERLYTLACGYIDGDPNTDQGGNEQHVLSYLLKHGMPMESGQPHCIAAFVEVDQRNLDDVKRAVFHTGFAYIGLSVPAFLMDGEPPAVWDVNPDGDNTIVGGHAIILPGYNAQSVFSLVSWGAKYKMTPAFFHEFVDEVYCLADLAWITAKGMTPGGLTLTQLEAQMAALRGA